MNRVGVDSFVRGAGRRGGAAVLFSLVACLLGARLAAATAPPAPVYAYVLTNEGRLRAFRTGSRGELLPLPRAAVAVPLPPRPLLAVHPSGRYVYAATRFDGDVDGYSYEEFLDGRTVPRRHATTLFTYAVSGNGAFALRQRLTVPSVFGDLVFHPSGRFLYGVGPSEGGAGAVGPGSRFVGGGETTGRGARQQRRPKDGIFIFRTGPDGRLRVGGRTRALYTFGLMATMPGERDAWDLSFTRDGRYAYAFCGDGFSDHSENYGRRYRVRSNGTLQPASPVQTDAGEDMPRNPKAGWFRFVPGGRWALGFDLYRELTLYWVDGRGRLAPYPRNFGRLPLPTPPRGVPRSMLTRSNYTIKAMDPRGRFFYTGSDFAGSVLVAYRLGERGGAVPTGTFGVPIRGLNLLTPAPSGRLLYDVRTDGRGGRGSYLVVYAVDAAGRVTPHLPKRPFLDDFVAQFVFAAPGLKR